MNKMIYAVTLALFSLSPLAAARASKTDFIRDAITKGNLDVVNACIETDYAISLKDKQDYIALARSIVEKKKSDAKKTSVFVSIDGMSLALGIASTALLAWDAYDTYTNKDGKSWKSHALFGLSLCKLADSAIKVSRDLSKEEKNAVNAIANAESVAAAIDRL